MLHLLVQRLVMYRSVLNADFVLAILEVVKVSNSVLHPVLVITLGEILTCMRSSALLQHRQIKSAWTHCTHTHTLPLSCLHTHARTHTHSADSVENWINRSMQALGSTL